MSTLFPYANVLAGLLLLIVGFGFHFCGQLLSIPNWPLAERLGLQEANMPSGYRAYENGTAMGDVLLGWTYGFAAFGLLFGADWGYAIAVIPGAILTYHAACAWFWEAGRRRDGHGLWTNRFRTTWRGVNLGTGLLALTVAWAGPA